MRKSVIVVATILSWLATPANADCEPVQWIVAALATHQGIFSAKDVLGEAFVMPHPWTVPYGKTVGISSVLYQQKHLASAHPQASYFALYGWFSVPSNIGSHTWWPPLRLPEGTDIDFFFINAPSIGQWHAATVTGWLSDDEDLSDCPGMSTGAR